MPIRICLFYFLQFLLNILNSIWNTVFWEFERGVRTQKSVGHKKASDGWTPTHDRRSCFGCSNATGFFRFIVFKIYRFFFFFFFTCAHTHARLKPNHVPLRGSPRQREREMTRRTSSRSADKSTTQVGTVPGM